MHYIFCNNFLAPREVDPDYASEYNAVKKLGFEALLISYEAVKSGQLHLTLSTIPTPKETVHAIYRGWMLTSDEYATLYEGLKDKNIVLLNDPVAYKYCHHLPDSYSAIKGHTPHSVWSQPRKDFTDVHILQLTQSFGDAPIIVKDYVKSEKHYWNEACFIPTASNAEKVLSVTRRFLELRGDAFNEGLVFRSFESLQFLTDHTKSGMPLTKEFRLFFAKNTLVSVFHYWDEGEYGDLLPPLDRFETLATTIQSNFFTMDVAQKENGEWIVMELGDGQVSGLPENADAHGFYQNLSEVVG